jgi:hypothetical protein
MKVKLREQAAGLNFFCGVYYLAFNNYDILLARHCRRGCRCGGGDLYRHAVVSIGTLETNAFLRLLRDVHD